MSMRCPTISIPGIVPCAVAKLASLVPLAWICIFGLGCGQDAAPGGEQVLSEADRLRAHAVELIRLEQEITTEYPLARQADPYLVVDLSARTVELKAAGRKLRVFTVSDFKRPAEAASEKAAWSLVDTKPLQRTERTKIKPGAGQEGVVAATSQEPWGPHRMPADYDLVCADGRILEVRSLPSDQSGSLVVGSLRKAYRRLVDQIRHMSESGQDADHVLQIWLAEQDSQLLFWSLPRKLKILVRVELDFSPLMDAAGAGNRAVRR